MWKEREYAWVVNWRNFTRVEINGELVETIEVGEVHSGRQKRERRVGRDLEKKFQRLGSRLVASSSVGWCG